MGAPGADTAQGTAPPALSPPASRDAAGGRAEGADCTGEPRNTEQSATTSPTEDRSPPGVVAALPCDARETAGGAEALPGAAAGGGPVPAPVPAEAVGQGVDATAPGSAAEASAPGVQGTARPEDFGVADQASRGRGESGIRGGPSRGTDAGMAGADGPGTLLTRPEITAETSRGSQAEVEATVDERARVEWGHQALEGTAKAADGATPAQVESPPVAGVSGDATGLSAMNGVPGVPAADLSPVERADRTIAEVADALRRLEAVNDSRREAETAQSGVQAHPVDAAPALREVAAAAAPAEVPVMDGGAAGEPAPEVTGSISVADACVELAVTGDLLRRLLTDFGDVLPPGIGSGRHRRLPRAAVVLLGEIIRWRREGLDDASVRRQASIHAAVLSAPDGFPPPGPPAGSVGAGADGSLLAQVNRLQDAIARQEARRAEDRDRLLTALMRTNQELQHLRFELTSRSRKERRRGFWTRLFQ